MPQHHRRPRRCYRLVAPIPCIIQRYTPHSQWYPPSLLEWNYCTDHCCKKSMPTNNLAVCIIMAKWCMCSPITADERTCPVFQFQSSISSMSGVTNWISAALSLSHSSLSHSTFFGGMTLNLSACVRKSRCSVMSKQHNTFNNHFSNCYMASSLVFVHCT